MSFFDGCWSEVPSLDEVATMTPASAARVLRVGDLGIQEKAWPEIGRHPDWERAEWPPPHFVRRSELSHRAWLVRYSDTDMNHVEAEVPTAYDTKLERDSLLGYGAAELVLTAMFSPP